MIFPVARSVRVATAAIPAVVIILGLSLYACATTTTPPDPPETSARLARPDDARITAPEGFRLDREASDLPAMISRLVSGESTTPILVRTMIYVPDSGSDLLATTGSITLTVATYPATVGALATYNGWFAEYGFPAAADRTSLDFGEAAERFDLEWPPLHAVIARDDARFALVVADGSLPAAIRSDAMEWLARAAMGAHQKSGDSDSAATPPPLIQSPLQPSLQPPPALPPSPAHSLSSATASTDVEESGGTAALTSTAATPTARP